jgi:diaminopimelate epimerase
MGNPHAVQIVKDVDIAAVAIEGPEIEAHTTFPKKVNAGFMQIQNRLEIKLRVFERGSGETLACGTGACAAVVSGILRGELDSPVLVHTSGGDLTIAWNLNSAQSSVMMTGPAQTVFEGEITIE